MKQMEYKVEAMHTWKVFEEFIKFTHRAKYPVLRTRLFLFACCFFAASYFMRNTDLKGRYIFGAVGIFLILYAIFMNKIAAVRLAGSSTNYKEKIPVIHEFYDEKFKVKNLGPDTWYSYPDIKEAYENNRYFFLNIQDKVVHVLPKNSLKEGTVNDFRAMIKERCNLEFQPTGTTFSQRYQAGKAAALGEDNEEK